MGARWPQLYRCPETEGSGADIVRCVRSVGHDGPCHNKEHVFYDPVVAASTPLACGRTWADGADLRHVCTEPADGHAVHGCWCGAHAAEFASAVASAHGR